MPPTVKMRLGPDLDGDQLAAKFALSGRLQIPNFLADDVAGLLADELAASDQWRRVINAGRTIYEIDRSQFDALPVEQAHALDAAINAEAAWAFRFRYDCIRVPDAVRQRRAKEGLLAAFAQLMSGRETLNLFERITNRYGLRFADAQATRYRRGDFLTRHDDAVESKDRRLAYVLGLTRVWVPEWGGLLLFNEEQGGVAEAMVPRFNALSVFSVPQPHSVSAVAPYADGDRLSVTGWLRGDLPTNE